jgi:RNA ligase (TIGR02306 family)
MTRKLAHIEQIEEIIPIEGADRIVQYRIGGWKVIDQKDKYAIGDLVCYCEIDSWMPNTLAPFLTKPGNFPKTYNGVEGQRLKSIRLKGAISQGLLISIENVANIFIGSKFDEGQEMGEFLFPSADVTELLGIIKWEPAPEKVPVNAMGSFPSHTPKTDQERCQNFMRSVENFLNKNPEVNFTAEEKAEGSSVTVFLNAGDFGICSRNLRLKLDDQDVVLNSPFTKPAVVLCLEEKLRSLGKNLALQFETIGPQVQSNYYNLNDWEYRLFDVFDIDKQEYFTPQEMRDIAVFLGLTTVPILETSFNMHGKTCEDLLAYAESEFSRIGSTKNLMREGVVFKSNSGGRFSLKAVSNNYLLKRGY